MSPRVLASGPKPCGAKIMKSIFVGVSRKKTTDQSKESINTTARDNKGHTRAEWFNLRHKNIFTAFFHVSRFICLSVTLKEQKST